MNRFVQTGVLLLSAALLAEPSPLPGQPAQAEARRAQDPSLDAVDSTLSALYPAKGPGAAVLVARNGRVLFRKAYGSADVELGVRMRPDHVLRLGSMTKQFTAVAALMLVDEGKISLNDDITRFFPGYPTQGRRITVEHLLTHTAGIRSYTAIPEFAADACRDYTVDQLIATFRDQPLEFGPGERWSYSNSGYALLGAIIEKASGTPYAEFLRTRIFEPLGMRDTRYESTNGIIPGRVQGYTMSPAGELVRAAHVSMTQPYSAGALAGTLDDLLLWGRAMAEKRLLKPETWARAHTAFKLADGRSSGYGYGWFVTTAEGRPAVEHGGDIDGFATTGLWIPSEQLQVFVLANHERAPTHNPETISLQIARAVLGAPTLPAPPALDPAALEAYAGVYGGNDADRRVVKRDGGALYIERVTGARQPLRAVGTDEFLQGDGGRVRFMREGGAVVGLLLTPRLGPELMLRRAAGAANPPVVVPPAVLASYAGVYEITPGMTATIRVDGTVLKGLLTGQPEATLVPESETRFSVVEAPAYVTFQRDAAGAVTGLILTQGGSDLPARRLP